LRVLKELLKRYFRKFDFEIVRKKDTKTISPPEPKKTVKSDKLSFYKTKTGNYFLPTDAGKDVIARKIIKDQIFEEEVVNLASTYIKPQTIVLDLGSNFGQMSILFANMVGKGGRVYACEADEFLFKILKKNINANNLGEVVLANFGAVHDQLGETLFFPEQTFERFNTYGSYGVDYNAISGRKVKSITVDSLKIEEPISFMKIDVQGGDLKAMQGAKNTISRNQMPILFEYEYQFEEEFNYSFQDYVDFVMSIGYKFHRVINGHNFLIIPSNNCLSK